MAFNFRTVSHSSETPKDALLLCLEHKLRVAQMTYSKAKRSGIRVLPLAMCALLGACATSQSQWEVHHVGRVEARRTVSTIPPPSGKYAGLYAFGAVGGIVAAALQSQPDKIERYSIRTKNNEVVEVQWPEALEIGQCVAVVGEVSDIGGLSYPFPTGRIVGSSDCK